ncbi:MAG: NADH-quinone oxidoreductase subunit NuoF [Solirubrobacteraceae bacterium]
MSVGTRGAAETLAGTVAGAVHVTRFGHGSRVPGWERAADLTKEPADIPDPAAVPVPQDLRSEIEAHMARYPDRRSAALPALAAAQRVHGWCSPEAIAQVACVMRVTPAELAAVVTFYDMLSAEPQPVGHHDVYVCTNISCSLRGADALYAAISEAAAGEETLNVRSFECLGACEMAPMASVDGTYVGPLESADVPRMIDDLLAGRPVLEAKQLERRPCADAAGAAHVEQGGASAPRPAVEDAGADAKAQEKAGKKGAGKKGKKKAEGETAAGTKAEPAARAAHAAASEHGAPKLLLAGIDEPGLATLEVYRRRGGYESLAKALQMSPEEVLAQLEASGLRGRGGAGFQMAKKISFLPKGVKDKYLVCNADESEPGTFKDRELLQKSPHMLLEGIAIACHAAQIDRAYIYIRGEYAVQATIVEAALAEAQAEGLLGSPAEPADGAGAPSVVVHRGAGAYICGEETGLLDSLEGKRGNPRLKPPFPAIQGLYQGPTLINNVETLATVPAIMRMGGERYAKLGTETSTGTKLVSVSGHVQRPGNYEIELGIPAREIIYGLAGGPPDGREVKAWFPGGSSSPLLTASELDLPYDFDTLAKAGSMLGSGAIIVVDDATPILDVAFKVAKFYAHESCGKCTPCREGTNWTMKMLARMTSGEATPMDIEIMSSVQDNIIGHCLCVLGDAMAMPIGSIVARFRDELEEHIEAARREAQDAGMVAA